MLPGPISHNLARTPLFVYYDATFNQIPCAQGRHTCTWTQIHTNVSLQTALYSTTLRTFIENIKKFLVSQNHEDFLKNFCANRQNHY